MAAEITLCLDWARAPFGRGWLWFGLLIHSNSPLRPAAVDKEGGQSERHRVSPPHAPCPLLALPTPPHRHPLHARASGLLLLLRAAACQAAALLLPSPPAACSTCRRHMRGALLRTYTDNWVGGWVEISYARRFRPWASALMVGLVDRRLLSFGSLRAVPVGAVECGMLLLMALMALSADRCARGCEI